MTIDTINIYRYSLPLHQPLFPGRMSMTTREGCLLNITLSDGSFGWGETAPLLSFSRESLDTVVSELTSLAGTLAGQAIPEGSERLHGEFDELLASRNLFPSVRCGLEMALLGAIARGRRLSLAHLLNRSAPAVVPLNALITEAAPGAYERARQIRHEGYCAVKVKVGRDDVQADIERVRGIRDRLGPAISLRLDANRSWSLARAEEFCRGIGSDSIEYIEEPLSDPNLLVPLLSRIDIGLALDESVLDRNAHELIAHPGVVAVILKPTLLGGFDQTAKLARFAADNHTGSVISSTYESSLGLTALGNLAAALTPGTPAGLDTAAVFTQDILIEPVQPDRGALVLNTINEQAVAIDRGKLQRLTS